MCYFQNPDYRSQKYRSFCVFASNKASSIIYSTNKLCLFSKQTDKEEAFTPQQFTGNDVFLVFLFGLANDTF